MYVCTLPPNQKPYQTVGDLSERLAVPRPPGASGPVARPASAALLKGEGILEYSIAAEVKLPNN